MKSNIIGSQLEYQGWKKDVTKFSSAVVVIAVLRIKTFAEAIIFGAFTGILPDICFS